MSSRVRVNRESETIHRYYSQCGEDYLLWKFFDFKREGYFIDIGAFDGSYISNTFSFEQKGWRGICVEPHPEYFALCQKNRPHSICINAACVGDEETAFIEMNMDDTGLYSSAVDTQAYHDEVSRNYCGHRITFNGLTKQRVGAITLNRILDKLLPKGQAIDFLSIDVEGFEEDVLKGFDLQKFRPELILIEANTPEAQRKLIDYFTDTHHYAFARTVGVNMFFLRDQDAIERILSIPIRCCIEKQLHPKGVEYSLKNIMQGHPIDETREQIHYGYNGMALTQALAEIDATVLAVSKRHSQFILYGAGTVGAYISRMAEKHVFAVVDAAPKSSKLALQGIRVFPIDEISGMPALPIIIAVLGREREITAHLINQLSIPQERIVVLHGQKHVTDQEKKQSSP